MHPNNPIINKYRIAKEKRIAESISKQPLLSCKEVLERAMRLRQQQNISHDKK